MHTRLAIFVVGADGSGKTEISTHLSGLMGIKRFKCPSEKEWFKTNSFHKNLAFDALLPSFCEQTNTSFISDRGYPCEWVYASFYKRETDYDLLQQIDDAWSTRGGMILHLTRSDYSNVQDELVKTEDLQKIDNLYRLFVSEKTKLPSITICTDDFPTEYWVDGVALKAFSWIAKTDKDNWLKIKNARR